MNQTDLQGETERALRAITCEGCKQGIPIEIIADYPSHRNTQAAMICHSKHAALLPLFNAGIAGAYAAAAKEAGFRVRFLITGTPDEQAAHIESCILALTPADARLAQEQLKRTQFVAGLTEARRQYADQAAAIASAEARARMEEHLHYCDRCMLATPKDYCYRGKELFAAARTLDSTKEPE